MYQKGCQESFRSNCLNIFFLQDLYDDDDDDDEWIFDPAIDAILNSYKRNREEAFSEDDDDD